MSALAISVSEGPHRTIDWMGTLVSSKSRYGDDLWLLDIQTAGWRADQSCVDWKIPVREGDKITAAEHAALVQAAKQFLWTIVTDPPSGRKRISMKTLKGRAEMRCV